MNNNTLIDRYEDDRQPDYPYDRDHRGYNAYGGFMLSEDTQVTVGRLSERQLSSARKSRANYGLFTANPFGLRSLRQGKDSGFTLKKGDNITLHRSTENLTDPSISRI